MSQSLTSLPDDLQQLQQQLTEFRSTHRVRSRLPEPFWVAAAEVAKHYGVHRTARALHLDYVGLKKRVEGRKRPKVKRTASGSAPTFMELVAPTAATSRYTVEVEATSGKLRLELPATTAAELAPLLRAFLGQ
jgi:tRNA G18 (ribose-2'-O)-methylase SpoU